MGKTVSLAGAAEALEGAGSVLVLGHARPDGDALGSQLGLARVLRERGKEVVCWNAGPLPGGLMFLPGMDEVVAPDGGEAPDFDLVVALDTANRERLGDAVTGALDGRGKWKAWLTIDHHASNEGYGDLVLVNGEAPATGEIVHDLCEAAGWEIPAEAAECLYVAISTDTGSFQYASTTAHTYEVVSRLVRRGVDVARVNRLTYHNHGARRVELLKSLLNHSTVSADGKVADCVLTMAEKERIGHRPGDGEGLIDILRGIDTVVVAAWFEETEDGKVRVSLRSKDKAADVSALAARFGGGGHVLAAGVRMPGPLGEAREKVLAALGELCAGM